MNTTYALTATSDSTPLIIIAVIALVALIILITAVVVYIRKRK